MDSPKNDYKISFFRPATPFGKANRNFILILLSIWFIGVFGFQIALKILEKPTPEKTLLAFNATWGKALTGEASIENKQELAKSLIAVLGKITVKPKHQEVLSQSLSWVVYGILDEGTKTELITNIHEVEEIKNSLSKQSGADFDNSKVKIRTKKDAISKVLCPALNIDINSIEAKLLPFHLSATDIAQLSNDNIQATQAAMNMYLIHNQSVLTDTKFLGFPFHYFYTAVFLLILFVGICWFYCVRIEVIQKRYSKIKSDSVV